MSRSRDHSRNLEATHPIMKIEPDAPFGNQKPKKGNEDEVADALVQRKFTGKLARISGSSCNNRTMKIDTCWIGPQRMQAVV